MQRLRILALAVLVATTGTLTPSQADATEMIVKERTGHRREMQLDVIGAVWPFGLDTWVGAIALFGFPILDEGFVAPWNDSFVIEGGVATTWMFDGAIGSQDQQYLVLTPLAGVRWNVHLLEQLTVFATFKVGINLPIAGDTFGIGNSAAVHATVGAYWLLSDAMYIRADVGNYGIIHAGVGFPLGTP